MRCLPTPVHDAEPHQPEPYMLPEGIQAPPPRKLIDHPDLEIPMPTLIGMTGFAGFRVCVALLIAFVYWMATWGA